MILKWIIRIMAVGILIAIFTGFYFRINNNFVLGDRIIGVSVLVSAFIFMPIWLYVRWNGKHLKDYTLTKENMDKMKDRGID